MAGATEKISFASPLLFVRERQNGNVCASGKRFEFCAREVFGRERHGRAGERRTSHVGMREQSAFSYIERGGRAPSSDKEGIAARPRKRKEEDGRRKGREGDH
jgi:hypothetical protein